jgi:ParB family transcriptional regulator, chromosome partitioning protein
MKRDLLAKSLAQMGSRPADLPTDQLKADEAPAPRSLKSMSDVLSQVSAQSAQEVDINDIAESEIADRFDVNEGLDDLIESIRTSGQQLPALLRYRRGAGPRYEVVYGCGLPGAWHQGQSVHQGNGSPRGSRLAGP